MTNEECDHKTATRVATYLYREKASEHHLSWWWCADCGATRTDVLGCDPAEWIPQVSNGRLEALGAAAIVAAMGDVRDRSDVNWDGGGLSGTLSVLLAIKARDADLEPDDLDIGKGLAPLLGALLPMGAMRWKSYALPRPTTSHAGIWCGAARIACHLFLGALPPWA